MLSGYARRRYPGALVGTVGLGSATRPRARQGQLKRRRAQPKPLPRLRQRPWARRRAQLSPGQRPRLRRRAWPRARQGPRAVGGRGRGRGLSSSNSSTSISSSTSSTSAFRHCVSARVGRRLNAGLDVFDYQLQVLRRVARSQCHPLWQTSPKR